MKLTFTQVFAGVFTVLASGYIIWWMFFGATPLLEDKVLNASGVLVNNVTPENEALFTAAHYISFFLPACGLAAVFLGAFGKRIASARRLAMLEIALGVVIIPASIFIFIWGYSLDFVVMIEGGPVLDMSRAKAYTVLTTLLGLVITGVGIAQFIRARR